MPRLRLLAGASVSSWRSQCGELQKRSFCSSSTVPYGAGRWSSLESKEPDTDGALNRTVFVRLSKGLTSPVQTLSLLAEMEKRFGPIQGFHFPREPQHQRLLGYGSVTFTDIRSFDKAIKASSTESRSVTLPSFLPSRAPRTYLIDTLHSHLVGLKPLFSCPEPPAGTPAQQVHYTSRNLQNPSSMRPSWNDIGHLLSMKTSPSAHYVDASQAGDATPADAIIAHDSAFYVSDAPITVELRIERRHTSIKSRPPERGASLLAQLRKFGGFSGVITEMISEADVRWQQAKQSSGSRRSRTVEGLPFSNFSLTGRYTPPEDDTPDAEPSNDTKSGFPDRSGRYAELPSKDDRRNQPSRRGHEHLDTRSGYFNAKQRGDESIFDGGDELASSDRTFNRRADPRERGRYIRRSDDGLDGDVRADDREAARSSSNTFYSEQDNRGGDRRSTFNTANTFSGSRARRPDNFGQNRRDGQSRQRDSWEDELRESDSTGNGYGYRNHRRESPGSFQRGGFERRPFQPRSRNSRGQHREFSRSGASPRSYSTGASLPDKSSRKADWKRTRHSSFVDQITVRLNGGKGGDGCVSFHREKFVEYGPPSGGNGGTGGSVYIRAIDGPTSLARIARRSRAPDASHGQGSSIHGRKAADKIIEVPVGTVVTAVKRLRVKEDEEARVYRDDLLRRAAKAKWDPLRSVEKEDFVLAAEHAELERIRSSLRMSRDEDVDQDQDPKVLEKYKELVDKVDGEALLDPETAQRLQSNRDRVWRHYPRAAETNYRRSEFRAAEMRLALDYRRLLSTVHSPQELNVQSVAAMTPFEGEEEESRWQFDFDEPTPEDSPGVLIASGGKGGYGNGTFLSSQNRSPKFATRGEYGEVVEVLLELKKPSDIGLVGLPNAGKSTILRSLSAARAEVGHWQFTTLSPNIGVVRLDEQGNVLGVDKSEVVDGHGSDRHGGKDAGEEGFRLVLADIPGLIDGASDNRGLGHTFLRHIERCSVLAYVLDLNQPDPSNDLRVLHTELATYRTDLVRKAQLIIANKADLFGSEDEVSLAKQKLDSIRLEATKIWEDMCATAVGHDALELRESGPMKLVTVSAKKKQGTDVLAKALAELLKARRAQEEALIEDANYDSSW